MRHGQREAEQLHERTWAVSRVKVMLEVLRPSASKLSPSNRASFCLCVRSVLSRLVSQEFWRNMAVVRWAFLHGSVVRKHTLAWNRQRQDKMHGQGNISKA